jgi:nucleoside-diphosphate-sugar epimerase
MRPAHVADLVRAVLLVIDRDDLGHEVINIGGARSVDFRELISMIGERVGRSPIQLSAPRWIRRPADVATRAWRSAGQPPALLLRLAREWINASVSIDKARRLLGFEPVPLEWGLDQTAMELRLAGAL